MPNGNGILRKEVSKDIKVLDDDTVLPESCPFARTVRDALVRALRLGEVGYSV